MEFERFVSKFHPLWLPPTDLAAKDPLELEIQCVAIDNPYLLLINVAILVETYN